MKQIEKNIYFENDILSTEEHIYLMMKRPYIPYVKASRIMGIISGVAAALLILVMLVCGQIRGTARFLYYIPFLVWWVIVNVRGAIPAFRARRQYAAQGKYDVGYHYVFDDDTLIMYAENNDNEAIPYAKINSINDDGDAFVLRNRFSYVVRIPKNSFTYGDPNEFYAFILDRIKSNKPASNRPMITSIFVMSFFTALFLIAAAYIVLHYLVVITYAGAPIV